MKKKHIAFIPARKGSVGFKNKNRIFFDNTADFLDSISWFDDIIVSSDDSEISKMAVNRKYNLHQRSNLLSGSDVSIKSVIINVISEMGLGQEDYVWLFYLPILYKNLTDFEKCKNILEQEKALLKI